MTVVEMGRACRVESNRSSYLSLADAMREAVRGRAESEEDREGGVETRRVKSPPLQVAGVRYQRCGGGRRVIRRKRGGE